MPRISEFYGITIAVYYNDHAPPHVHATYGGHRAAVGIDPTIRLAGRLPARALALVTDWIALHRTELLENWRRVQRHEPPLRVAPLD